MALKLLKWPGARSPAGLKRYQCGSVVERLGLHLYQNHESALTRLEIIFSRAVGRLMQWLKDRLLIELKEKRLLAADLLLDEATASDLPDWAKKIFGDEPLKDLPKSPLAIRLAWGQFKKDGDGVFRWKVGRRSARFELQQLFLALAPADFFNETPSPLRAGITQEAAQQLLSHLLLLDSGKILEANFPTTEERDPRLRVKRWAEAVWQICRRSCPFPYKTSREVDPRKYGADDPRGNRLVNVDPLWQTVIASPAVRSCPILYPVGKKIGLYERRWPGSHKSGSAHQTFAALPVSRQFLENLPPAVKTFVSSWRRWQDELRPLNPEAPALKPSANILLLPLSYSRRRSHNQVLRALAAGRLKLQWARLVRKGDRWQLQLTIGYGTEVAIPSRALAVHFGLDNIYYWSLAEETDSKVCFREEGFVEGNPILAHGLAKKDDLEWDQRRGRWVGGRVYSEALKTDTHKIVDQVLKLVLEKKAGGTAVGLGLETIFWVPKGEGPPEANRRFSAWNYGQLPRYLSYKARVAGIAVTEIWPKKEDRQQSDAEQARGLAVKALRRFQERARRAKRAEEDNGQ